MKPKTLPYQGYYCEGSSAFQFLYGHDKQRRKTSFYDDNSLTLEMKEDDDNPSIFLVEQTPMSERVNREGRYRNPNDWSYNILNPSPTWLRGYTGHCLSRSIFSMFSYEIENSSKITIGKHLPHFDLINMLSEAYIFCSGNGEKYLAEQTSTTIEMSSSRNGRVYDPILGRMLSPDRFVQSPGYSQSYNRYSYCWNNPLRYTDPSGDIVLGPIIAFAVAGAITNVMLDRYDEDFSFMGSALKGAAFGAAIGSGVAWAATAMGAAGAIATTGALKAKKISAQLIGGMNNALYNYESNQSFLVSSGYFLSGMLGTAIGTGMAGAESGRVVLGMMSNAALNPLIAWADKNTDMDEYGLVATQKIIGGALNTFQSTAMYNTDLTYMGFENNSLGKGLNYAAQAVASEFAYTKAEGWNDLNYALYPFKASAGFVSGIVNYEINKINFDGRQKEFWQVGLTALSKGLATASFTYLWDYGFQHNTSSVDGGALTDYDGRWQKQRISFNKFVGVTLQTIFEPYD